jgi:hypothetical protein
MQTKCILGLKFEGVSLVVYNYIFLLYDIPIWIYVGFTHLFGTNQSFFGGVQLPNLVH